MIVCALADIGQAGSKVSNQPSHTRQLEVFERHAVQTGQEDVELVADLYATCVQIGAARNRGIDILVNEVSNRQTPYAPSSHARYTPRLAC